MKLKRIALILPLLLAIGCASRTYVNHPGSFNTFDSQTYDTLLVTDSVIQSTKADLAANKFPAQIAGAVKTALNNLITAYDVADSSYLVYHAALAAGNSTAAQQTSVATNISNVNTATSNLTSAKAGN